ncbi:MAG: hypothetical protein ABSA76_06235 [Bacteroidales bacterium]
MTKRKIRKLKNTLSRLEKSDNGEIWVLCQIVKKYIIDPGL